MAESPESPLSSHASSEFTEDVKLEERELESHESLMIPRAKRQRLAPSTFHPSPYTRSANPDEVWEISSDSSGDLPHSPLTISANMQDDDHGEQVTICAWRGCERRDLGNMDDLVEHIHEAHIGSRQKKYACEWEGCARMDAGHASGYALRAHMRKHTKEKPFYCAVPECDKSFTRSDALAKHMRTVHETDAFRPVDSALRTHGTPHKPQRLKLILNSVKSVENDGEALEEAAAIDAPLALDDESGASLRAGYSVDIKFADEELRTAPEQLFRLLRRQLHWTSRKHEQLAEETADLDKKAKAEWQAKELVLSNLIEAELGTASMAQPSAKEFATIVRLKDELLPAKMLQMTGKTPWYRTLPAQEAEDSAPRDGVTVDLASS